MRSKRRYKKRFTFRIIRLFLLIVMVVFFIKGTNSLSNKLFNYRDSIVENDLGSIINNAEKDTEDILKSMIKQDKRIKVILENYNDYPEELLEMLSRNIEMIDFVLNYSSKKGEVYADAIGDISDGNMPLLLQYDERWGYGNYGDNILAITGCGPTSLSMVVAKLTGNNDITPYKIAKYAEDNGYYAPGIGTSWNLFTEGSEHFGLRGKELPLSEKSIYNTLQSDKPIICSVRSGDFTTASHIIVLREIKDGKIAVHDPNSRERSNILWDYRTLEKQIRNLWTFDLM